jgi:hypothetical protein
MKCSWLAGIAAGLLALQAPPLAAQDTAASANVTTVVSAVWVRHEVAFTYMGFTSFYSCDGLRAKVSRILKALGARPGFKVSPRACFELTGPEAIPGVTIVAEFPAVATPELLASLASDASKRELTARATGKATPAVEATAQFPARVKRLEFRSTPYSLDVLQDGDCELMEQLRDRVFGPLGVKVVDDRTRCMPRQVSLGAVRMTVEVLEPVPVE